MPIRFPHATEIPLSNPPLAEVICQVRFPPILRIKQEEPTAFQEQVRKRFPEFGWERGMQIHMPRPGSSGEPAAGVSSQIYRFHTPNEETFVSLAPDFFALSAKTYRHWKEFAADLRLVHEAMQKVYEPAYATRIGLRYVNRLTRENSGVQSTTELFNLLRPELTAVLQTEVGQAVDGMLNRLVFTSEEDAAQLNLHTAYEQEDAGLAFVVDLDYFQKGNLSLEDLVDRCRGYHDIIYDAFRWCLRDESLERFRSAAEEGRA